MSTNHGLSYGMLSQGSREVVLCYLRQEVLRAEENLHSIQMEQQILSSMPDFDENHGKADILRAMFRRDIFTAAIEQLESVPPASGSPSLVGIGDA